MRTKEHRMLWKVPSHRLCFRDESLMIDCVRLCLLCASQSLASSSAYVVLVHFTSYLFSVPHIQCGTHNKCDVFAHCFYLVLMSRFNATKLFALDCFRNVYSAFLIFNFLCSFVFSFNGHSRSPTSQNL